MFLILLAQFTNYGSFLNLFHLNLIKILLVQHFHETLYPKSLLLHLLLALRSAMWDTQLFFAMSSK